VVQGAVDAMLIINRIKDKNKRAALVYRSMGYANWEVGLILGKSERTIERYFKWLKINS